MVPTLKTEMTRTGSAISLHDYLCHCVTCVQQLWKSLLLCVVINFESILFQLLRNTVVKSINTMRSAEVEHNQDTLRTTSR